MSLSASLSVSLSTLVRCCVRAAASITHCSPAAASKPNASTSPREATTPSTVAGSGSVSGVSDSASVVIGASVSGRRGRTDSTARSGTAADGGSGNVAVWPFISPTRTMPSSIASEAGTSPTGPCVASRSSPDRVHTFTDRSAAAETMNGPAAARWVTACSWAKRAICSGLMRAWSVESSRQRRMRLSAPAANTCRMSGVMSTAFCSPSGCGIVSSRRPVAGSQTFTVSSALAEASTVPSADQARSNTAPLCPVSVRIAAPVWASHSSMRRS